MCLSLREHLTSKYCKISEISLFWWISTTQTDGAISQESNASLSYVIADAGNALSRAISHNNISLRGIKITRILRADFLVSLLAVKDWLSLVPPTAFLAGIGYMSYLAFCPHGRPVPSRQSNQKIRKNEAKVVDTIDIEDIAEKAAFCRCWKSNNVSKKKNRS